jgi:hypothetical protein
MAPQETNQPAEDDQQNVSFFGEPGSTKRWCWYIGAGVVAVITATAIYFYYRDNHSTQPTNNPVVVQPQPITTTSTSQETTQQPAIPTDLPTQPQTEPQTAGDGEQTHPDTLSEPDEENWGDFDASASLSTIRQSTVLTAEDNQAIENDLEAARKQAIRVEIEGLRKRRFRTFHRPKKHHVSQSLDLQRMPSPEAIDPTMAKTLKKLSLQTL